MMKCVCTTFLWMIAVIGVTSAGEPALKPVDEAAKNPSFFIFRSELLKVVATRNTEKLYTFLADDINNGFGGEAGIAEFKAMWKPESPESEIWGVLGGVLSMGGRFLDDGKVFATPYYCASFPEALDPFENVVIIGENVRLRKSPNGDAEVVGSLSWNIVKVAEDDVVSDANATWVKVISPDGKKGYVSREFARSPLDMRISFQKAAGRWRLVSMVSGD